jgi:hypothetical protein
MVINGKEIESPLDEDATANALAIQYWAIKQEFQAKKFPPTEENFINKFKTEHKISMSMDEFLALKSYAEEVYTDILSSKIQEDYESGAYEKLL